MNAEIEKLLEICRDSQSETNFIDALNLKDSGALVYAATFQPKNMEAILLSYGEMMKALRRNIPQLESVYGSAEGWDVSIEILESKQALESAKKALENFR